MIPAIPDDTFVRGDVPMTKEEVRSISIAKLKIKKDAVVYDVGAGTGSISVEAAMVATQGNVYAIEQKVEAQELIRENAWRRRHWKNCRHLIAYLSGAVKESCMKSWMLSGRRTHLYGWCSMQSHSRR